MAEKPDGCSSTCNPKKTCCYSSGRGACSCRAAGVLCTDYCPCGKERQCSNKPISKKPTTIANSESDKVRAMTRRIGTMDISETTTESTYLAKTSAYTIASATTGGGCSFDDLVHGEKNYVCEASHLLNLEEEPTYASDETEEKANQQVARLIGHLNEIFRELKIQGKTVQEFYIGKTFAPKSQRKGVVFKNMDPSTFTKNGICSRWSSYYKRMGYDGLIVLTVVTKNLLLPKERRQKYKDQEDYALMLERRLIEYYRDEISDPRIENPTLKEGGKSSVLYAGYPVYVAVRFKPKSTCVKLKK